MLERMNTAHTLSVQEVLRYYKSDENHGLSEEQVKTAQAKYGPNGEFTFSVVNLIILPCKKIVI